MEQWIINIENPAVIPTLRKMLEKVEGISVFQKRLDDAETEEEKEPCMTKSK